TDRREREQALRNLDEPATVVAVRERAHVDGEQKVRDPVADDGEAGEGRRVEGLEDHPVADHVLDVLGDLTDQREEKIPAVVAMVQRPEPRGGRERSERSTHSRDATSWVQRSGIYSLAMVRHFGVLIPSTNTTVEMECRLWP